MLDFLPYGLRKIWGHPANRAPGGLQALTRCLQHSGACASYQLQKQLGVFPAQGRVIPLGGWAAGAVAGQQPAEPGLLVLRGARLADDAVPAPLPAAG